MITCTLTIDYEIYGNGEGSLKDLVYEPAERLMAAFGKRTRRFVPFVEVAELEMIESSRTDPAIELVKQQIRKLYKEGFELGLHLHPQWYNGRYANGKWLLDYGEYNLCTLPRERIVQIVDRSMAYLRNILDEPNFTPLSFRAGNWLLQPTGTVAGVLAERGIKVDSSLFKGGLQHGHGLDYRRAPRNAYYWKFANRVDTPDSQGYLLELPIYTNMIPTWKMFTAKRVNLQQKGSSAVRSNKSRLYRIADLLRFHYPLKLDFCRMTINELMRMVDKVIRDDQMNPSLFRPIVAIGHTKDLIDFKTVELFLDYLDKQQIDLTTFEDVYPRCIQ